MSVQHIDAIGEASQLHESDGNVDGNSVQAETYRTRNAERILHKSENASYKNQVPQTPCFHPKTITVLVALPAQTDML